MDRFERDGLTFDVLDQGPPAGTPVVLLHGFPQDPGCFDAVVPALHAAGLRTLAPLQRGYAPLARPDGRRAYSVDKCADDVVALLDAAGLASAHVVGHDWGGMIAWALAGRHPARVASLTSLSTPHPAAMRHAMLHSSQALRSWYMAFFQLPAVPEILVRRGLRDTLRRSGLPATDTDRYVAAMAQPGALTGALAWYRGLPFSWQVEVPPCGVPATYVWGRKDVALGRFAAEATGRYVSADYRFVELNAGHWLPETRPTEVAAVVLRRVGVHG